MPLYAPQNGWDGKVMAALSGDTAFVDASELYNVSWEQGFNPERRRQLGNRKNQFMPGRWEATGKCAGYFISGNMATKMYSVSNTTSQRSHSARGMIQFNLKIDFTAFPITVKAGALVAWPNATPTTTTATTGGSLAPGTYSYRVTALIAGVETAVSPAVAQVVPAGTSTNTVTITWTAVTGATGYKVYGRTSGTELLIANLGVVLTFTDTGAIIPAGAQPVAAAQIKLVGYLLTGCLLNTDTYELTENTYVEKPFSFSIGDIYDIYDTDTDSTLLPFLT